MKCERKRVSGVGDTTHISQCHPAVPLLQGLVFLTLILPPALDHATTQVTADHGNVSVLVSASQVSDAFNARASDKESFFLGTNILRCYNAPADMSASSVASFLQETAHTPPRLSLPGAPAYMAHAPPVRVLRPLKRTPYRCEYWVKGEYQTCLAKVSPRVGSAKQTCRTDVQNRV